VTGTGLLMLRLLITSVSFTVINWWGDLGVSALIENFTWCSKGPFGIVGRTIVLFQNEDDFKATSSVGPAIACGVIGVANSANS